MVNYKKFNILAWKEDLLTLAVVAVCLGLFIVFPTAGSFQKITSALFFLFIVPVLHIKLILKKNLRSFGLNLNHKKDGLLWGSIMFLFLAAVFYFLSKYPPFINNYPIMPAYISTNFWVFSVYELILVNLLFFLQNFFFQGFLLFSFMEKLGAKAVLIPIATYCGIILFSSGFIPKLIPSLFIFIIGTVISFKNKSFVYAYAAGLFLQFIFDAYLIYIFKNL